MGVFVLNKWKIMGGGCKKWTFPQRRVHYVQYQYLFILDFTYLGGAYAPNAPPLPTGLTCTCCQSTVAHRGRQQI